MRECTWRSSGLDHDFLGPSVSPTPNRDCRWGTGDSLPTTLLGRLYPQRAGDLPGQDAARPTIETTAGWLTPVYIRKEDQRDSALSVFEKQGVAVKAMNKEGDPRGTTPSYMALTFNSGEAWSASKGDHDL
ncbi:hypothetical protein NDU88_001563 [Pleurodeles waltl]|uniref:Uncharacterized protein n=1 Tax=Pleurodeles waltl TaxID=8319 RepID=A0AAV7NKI9_PLEWA|nr:hypothetical protein NDU88_001563 [Pleurodeles waltl]